MRRAAAPALAIALCLVSAARANAGPLTVRTTISPRSIYVADVVTASVSVFFDPRVVDPTSVRLHLQLGHWTQLEASRLVSDQSQTVARRVWSFSLACLSTACVPPPRNIDAERLPHIVVSADTVKGAPIQAVHAWPVVDVAGRFEPPAQHAPVPFIVQSALPPVGLERSSDWMAPTLLGLGIAALLAGAALGAWQLAGRRGRLADGLDVSRLEQDLARVRQARSESLDDRRRAVAVLARTLDESGSSLAATAIEIAWSKPAPSVDELDDLVSKVEDERGADR